MKIFSCNYNPNLSFGLKPVLNCSLKNKEQAVAYETEDTKEDAKFLQELCDKYHDKFFFLKKDRKFDLTRDKIFILKDKNEVPIAYAKCRQLGGAMQIDFLSSRADIKNQGAGTALMAGIAQSAINHKMDSIIVNNPDGAWAFYYRCGFRTNDDITELNAKQTRHQERTMSDLISRVKANI